MILVVLWVLCFDFGGCDLICDLVGFWVFVAILFWLDFGNGAWLELMSLKSSDHGGLEGELICDLVGFFTFNVFIL